MDVWESFEIIEPLRRIELIAAGPDIRDLVYLEERFGYEADGIGMRWAKIKRFLE